MHTALFNVVAVAHACLLASPQRTCNPSDASEVSAQVNHTFKLKCRYTDRFFSPPFLMCLSWSARVWAWYIVKAMHCVGGWDSCITHHNIKCHPRWAQQVWSGWVRVQDGLGHTPMATLSDGRSSGCTTEASSPCAVAFLLIRRDICIVGQRLQGLTWARKHLLSE